MSDPRILTMNRSMDLKDALGEEFWRELDKASATRKQNRDYYLLLMDALKWLDPHGWSDWYDEYVPEWNSWLRAGQALDVIERRVDYLLGLYVGPVDVDAFFVTMEAK